LISVLGAWLAKARGCRFVYWVMDLNPDEAVAAGWLRPGSLVAKCLEMASAFSLNSASKVIVLDHFVRERIVVKGIPPSKVAVVPLWPQEVQFDAAGRNSFRATHSFQGKFVVMYSGNHSPCHPLGTLLDAAQKLADDPRILFCFVGGGAEFQKIRELSSRLKNVVWLPYQPRCELASLLSAADLLVVVMGNPFVGIVHPCKIYNMLNIGAPILYIGPKASHVMEMLERERCGFGGAQARPSYLWAEHGQTELIVKHIHFAREALKTPRTETERGQAAGNIAANKTLSKLLDHFETPFSHGADASESQGVNQYIH